MSKQKLLYYIILCYFCFLPENSFSQLLNIDDIKFTYKDTKTFEEDVLLSALGLNESDIYNPQILSENIYKLEKFYFDNGFFDAKIDTAVKYDYADEEVFINVIVTENRHYKIDTLIYYGIGNLPENVQKLLFKNKKIKPGSFYSKTDIVLETNETIDILQNNGYMNARLKQDSSTIVKKSTMSNIWS